MARARCLVPLRARWGAFTAAAAVVLAAASGVHSQSAGGNRVASGVTSDVASDAASDGPRAVEVSAFAAGARVRALAFAPDRNRLAVVLSNGSLAVWDAPAADGSAWTESWRVRLSPRALSRVAFGPPGANIIAAAGDDGHVYVADPAAHSWRRLTAAPAATASSGNQRPLHPKDVTALAVAPDGRSVASGDADGGIAVTPLRGAGVPRLLKAVRAKNTIVTVAFDGPDRLTALNEDMDVVTWDLLTAREVRPVTRLTAYPDGITVALGSADYDPAARLLAIVARDGREVARGNRIEAGGQRSRGPVGQAPVATPSGQDFQRTYMIVPYLTDRGERRAPVLTGVEMGALVLSPGSCFALAGAASQAALSVWPLVAAGPPQPDHSVLNLPLADKPAALALDTSGQRLAVAFDDGRITMWSLSGTSVEDCRRIRVRAGVETEERVSSTFDSTISPLLTAGQPGSIAVLPFRVAGVNAEAGQALAELVRGELSQRGRLTMSPAGDDLDAIFEELRRVCDVGVCDPKVQTLIINRLKANVALVGSVTRVGDGMTIAISRYTIPTIDGADQAGNVRTWDCKRCSEKDLTEIARKLVPVIVRDAAGAPGR